MAFPLAARFRYIGAGPILVAALLTAAIIQLCWPFIHGVEIYPDPVASRAALNNIYKTRDFIAIGLGAALIPLLSLLIAGLCRWVAADDDAKIDSLNTLLLASLIFAAWRLAVACSIPADTFPPLAEMAALPVVAVLGLASLLRFRATLSAGQPLLIGSAMLVGTVLAFFAGLAVPLALSRLIPALAPHLLHGANHFVHVALGLVCAAMIFNWFTSTTSQEFERRTLLILKLMQLPIPLLLFYMVPPVIVDRMHRFANPYPKLLIGVLGAGCVACWYFMWRRFRKASCESDSIALLSRAIAPASIAAMLLFVASGAAVMPVAFRDYFHFGEQALPWQQLWDFGKRPYVDFVPIHGLMALMRGVFAQLFFDNTAAAFSSADLLLNGLACIALALTACAVVGPLGAMFLLLGALPDQDRMYFLAPALFLIASPVTLKRPARALCLWLILCLLMVGYNATVGPAFVLGTAPLAVWFFYRSCRQVPLGATVIVVAGIGVLAICWQLAPLRATEISFAHFLLDNAWTNEIAHAFSMEQGFNQRSLLTGPFSTAFSFEIARCGWVIICLLTTWLLWRELHKPRGERNAPLIALTICTTPVMLLTVPYVLGRMEMGELSRSGSLMHLGLFAIAPVAILLSTTRRSIVPSLLILSLVVGYFYPREPATLDLPALTAQAVAVRSPRAGDSVVDASAMGLSHIGTIVQPVPNFLPDLVALKAITDSLFKPGETFLDLTNEEAIYYYLNLPVPARYAPFVAANSRMQTGELDQLRANPVHAVLIDPAGWIDEAPTSLRCYELYREYVLKFPAVAYGQWVFLLDPARYPSLPAVGSADQLKLLDHAFRKDDLHRLPISWGESWPTLSKSFTPVATIDPEKIAFKHAIESTDDGWLKPTDIYPYFEYEMPGEIKAGTDADFVHIRLEFDFTHPDATAVAQSKPPTPAITGDEPAMACYWTDPLNGYPPPIYFKGATGDLLIPLGAYPRWLLCHNPGSFRLDLLNKDCARRMRVTQIEFLKFNPDDYASVSSPKR
jgi:hypothetical protein